MKLLNLEKEIVEAAAKEQFPNDFIEVDTTDWYMPSYEKGNIATKLYEKPLYLSTHYVYEDRIVQGNQTRYKVELTVIWLKDDPYGVIYDSKNRYYVAYEDQDKIQFCEYDHFESLILPYLEISE